MTLLYALDMLGTFAFAASGAIAGVQKKMDIYGISFLALVTAVGGGVTRDVLVGRVPPFIFKDWNYLTVSVATAFLVFLFHRFFIKNEILLLWMDGLGLGVFTVIGISVGRQYGLDYAGSIMMGIATGTFGGMFRDILRGETPFVLTREVYASACLMGGILFWVMDTGGIPNRINIAVTASFVFVVRMLSVYGKWSLPKPKKS